MVNVRLYVEGGGEGKSLKIECRKGFSELLSKAGLAGRMPRITACGPRDNAYRDFCIAQQSVSDRYYPVLLVDAEESVRDPNCPWVHLKNLDDWDRPAGAEDEQCFLMAQIMESWFLADRDALARYYGDGYLESALPGNPQIEKIPKEKVLKGLKQASRRTQKGSYNKGRHSFVLLAAIDPGMVRRAAPCADRLFSILNRLQSTQQGDPER